MISTGSPLDGFLAAQGVVILDGALATELERRGADLADPLWSAKLLVEDPETIERLHYDYFAAGADVATSASYQATFEGFRRRGIEEDAAADLMRLSVCLARRARDSFWSAGERSPGRLKPLVAASIGPYGAYLADGSEYHGEYGLTIDELMAFHRSRLEVLSNAGADLLACETIPCLAEGVALVRLLAEFPAVKTWMSFSCCDEDHVCGGDRFEVCVKAAAQSPQVVAVGLNCTTPRYVESLLAKAARATDKPLVVYPNSGESWDPVRHRWITGTGQTDFSAAAMRWRSAGARLIGGCCRTTPDDIRQIRSTLLA